MSPGTRAVLVTGAGGYLGGGLVRALAEDADRPVVASIRAGDAAALDARRAALEGALQPAARRRVRWHATDVARSDAFDDLDPATIGAIVHGASITRFNVERDLARATNVEGTDAVLRFARRCGGLESVTLLGSVYASGLREGLLGEEAWDDRAGFANEYEWSKWAAEERLRNQYGDLPWRVARIATAIAHDARGSVVQMNAIHNTLRLFHAGLISLLPGDPTTPLFFVTGEDVVRVCRAVAERGENGRFYHVTPRAADAITLGGLVDVAFETFGASEEFRRRRIPRPVYSDLESFRMLANSVRGLGGDILRQALDSVSPFAPQLFVKKDFAVENRERVTDERPLPGARPLLARTCAWLARTRWGRIPDPEAPPC